MAEATPQGLPGIQVRQVQLFERPVALRLPFRFGAATVTRAPQAFVRVDLQVGGRSSVGATAELMVPKWFDKNPALTHEQNFEQLRSTLRLAAEAWRGAGAAPSAHALSLAAGAEALQRAAALGLPRLAAQFGPAQLDKAVADALLRAHDTGWCAGVRAGLLGDPWGPTLPLPAATQVTLRHTVGLADRLDDGEPGPDPQDGLPATLAQAITQQGLTHFKLKLSGQADADLARLQRTTAVLQRHAAEGWRATLDGNESFADIDALARFWHQLQATPALQPLLQRTLLLEQPLPRATALAQPLHALRLGVPVIIDESDDHPEALATALALGYRGISTKACKGLYRSLQNAAWLAAPAGTAARALLSGEDLTCQAGLAVQQDTLLATSLGVTHIERNGHHYVDGFGAAPGAEAQAFLGAHPSLYARSSGGRARLAVQAGHLDTRTLHGPGFGSAVHPDWTALAPMA